MERRKILLGSGAALATVLAGCSSTETGEETTDDTDDENTSDDTGDENTSDDADDDEYDVPGVDHEKIDVDSDKISIDEVTHSGGALDVVVTTETSDTEVLRAEITAIGKGLADALEDPEAFADAVETIEWVVEYDGSRVFEGYVDVDWLLDYLEGTITEDELGDKIVATKA